MEAWHTIFDYPIIMSSKLFAFAIAVFVCTSCSNVSEITDNETVVFRLMDDTQEVLAGNDLFDFFDEDIVNFVSSSSLSDAEVTEIESMIDMGIYYMGQASNDFEVSYNEFEALNLNSTEVSDLVGQYIEQEIGFGGTGNLDLEAEACATANWLWGVMNEPLGLMLAGMGCDVEGIDSF